MMPKIRKEHGVLLAAGCLFLVAGCKKHVAATQVGDASTKTFVISGSGTLSAPTIITGGIETAVTAVPKDASPSCMCDPDALKQAVLDRIFDSGIGQHIYNDEQGAAYEHNLSLAKLNDAQRLIDKLRRYAARLTDRCLKDGYTNWISFYQSQHDDDMDALNHPQNHPKDTSAEDEQKKQKREVEECKRKGTVPAIPGGAL
jgi:hypothetical protein